jgi:copper chaperone
VALQHQGMTCGHYADAVRKELSVLLGVSAVQVNIATGTATMVSEHPLDPDTVRTAVAEAGYELTT